MIRRVYIIALVIVSFFMACSNSCFAQTIKCVERPSQNYIGFGDDLKYYQINYDPTQEKDYVAYTALIREKIKQRLKNIYDGYCGEGDVCLLFVLKSNGSLYTFDIDQLSIDNKELRNIATLGLKKASPFPAFPKTLPYDRMFFSIVISFQKND